MMPKESPLDLAVRVRSRLQMHARMPDAFTDHERNVLIAEAAVVLGELMAIRAFIRDLTKMDIQSRDAILRISDGL
jgi:hypothetical protein